MSTIGFGQTWIKKSRTGGVSRKVYIRAAQLDAFDPDFGRVDIEYIPSGRVRHLRIPDALALLSKFQISQQVTEP